MKRFLLGVQILLVALLQMRSTVRADGQIARGFTLIAHPAAASGPGDIWMHGDYVYMGSYSSCGSGVQVFDIRTPESPRRLQSLFSHASTTFEDVMVVRAQTPFFSGDLLATGLQPCNNDGARGVQLWDVTDPEFPQRLAFFDVGARTEGVHELYLFTKGDRALILAAVPHSEEKGQGGDLRIIDVSNPKQPRQIADWGIQSKTGLNPAEISRGGIPGVFAHSAWANEQGTMAYISYWDAGVVILDISDPASPQFLGRTNYAPGEEGNAHSAWPIQDGRFLLVADEDFSPGGSIVEIEGFETPLAPIYGTEGAGLIPSCIAGAIEGELSSTNFSGKIALVEGRDPSTTYRANEIRDAGAVAVLVYEDNPRFQTGFLPSITAASISRADGERLRAGLARGRPLRARISPDPNATWGFLRIYDIADPANPRQVSKITTDRTTECPSMQGWHTVHNPFVVGDTLYLSWYADGVRSFDISDVTNPRPMGLFVPPGRANVWGVAARNDLVAISDINNGLYLLKASQPDSTSFSIENKGGIHVRANSDTPGVSAGYAQVELGAGTTAPAGFAIVGSYQNGVLVSETAVPAEPAVTSGRIHVDFRRPATTAVAIANPGQDDAAVTFYFSDAAGRSRTPETTIIPARHRIARFLNESPFSAGSTDVTFTFSSSIPISFGAYRFVTNARGESLMATQPVAGIDSIDRDRVVIPHFVRGDGWDTEIVLINPTDESIGGTLEKSGGGRAAYSIAPRSVATFTSGALGAQIQPSAFVTVTPNNGATPAGFAIIDLAKQGDIVSTTAVPFVRPASSSPRFYVERSGDASSRVETAIVIANLSPSSIRMDFESDDLSGNPIIQFGAITVEANSQRAVFLRDIYRSAYPYDYLPAAFRGIGRFRTYDSTNSLAIMAFRTHQNSRGELLMTPVVPFSQNATPSQSDLFVPLWAHGGGFTTEWILFAGYVNNQKAGGTLQFFTNLGQAWR